MEHQSILPLVIEERQRVDLTFGNDGLRSLLMGINDQVRIEGFSNGRLC